MSTQVSELKQLYEQDYYLWLEKTIELLKSGKLNQLDWENLIEEIENLGRSEKRAVVSFLKQLIKHLLLYHYWPTERQWSGQGWLEEISNFRFELSQYLDSKTLKNYAEQELNNIYTRARKEAILKLNVAHIPVDCPYSLEQILNDDFISTEKN
ncbi:MAG: hypothetical protein RLZZ171_1218 [Cyanobacteriota bacterium]